MWNMSALFLKLLCDLRHLHCILHLCFMLFEELPHCIQCLQLILWKSADVFHFLRNLCVLFKMFNQTVAWHIWEQLKRRGIWQFSGAELLSFLKTDCFLITVTFNTILHTHWSGAFHDGFFFFFLRGFYTCPWFVRTQGTSCMSLGHCTI